MRVVPSPRLKVRRERTSGFISNGRNLTNMLGVWALKLNLADLTRKWCSGSTWSFDLQRVGSSPPFLRGWRVFIPHVSLYQSGPIVQAQLLLDLGGDPCK